MNIKSRLEKIKLAMNNLKYSFANEDYELLIKVNGLGHDNEYSILNKSNNEIFFDEKLAKELRKYSFDKISVILPDIK